MEETPTPPPLEPDWRSVASEVPGLAIDSVVRLGEGWSAVVYLVNDEFVFKCFKRPSEWDEIDHELAFLTSARHMLTLPVADHLHLMRRARGVPHGYAVYRYMRGRGINECALSHDQSASLARTMAHFLRGLHGLVDQPEVTRNLRHEDERQVSETYYQAALEHIAPRLIADERRGLDDVFQWYLNDPSNFPDAPCVLHADLSAAHILFDGGRVTGVLDWSDACLGDPDYDFSYLYRDLGANFVREIAIRYGHSDVDRLLAKSRYYSVVDDVDTIVYGTGRAVAGQETEAWSRLRRLLRTIAQESD